MTRVGDALVLITRDLCADPKVTEGERQESKTAVVFYNNGAVVWPEFNEVI